MSFREVTGHRSLLTLVSRAIAHDSLPPSLIFAGPEGVGKCRVAVAVAAALNCQAPVRAQREAVAAGPGTRGGAGRERADARLETSETSATSDLSDLPDLSEIFGMLDPLEIDACGTCPVCRRIGRGVHADVMMIAPGDTGAIKIDQIREATERAAYRPFEGRRRLVIIDDADALVIEAQNALLKTLEEPPSASVFVLVSARPDMLVPTVRSRCQRLQFGRLTAAEVAALLMRAHGYSEENARAAAAAADGSVGRALAEGSSESALARDAAARVLRAVSAPSDPRRRLDSAKELAASQGGKGSGPGADRNALAMRLRALGSLLRDLEVLSTRANEGLLANADLRPGLLALTEAFDGGRTVRAFSAVDRALGALVERNASPKVVADWLVFQL